MKRRHVFLVLAAFASCVEGGANDGGQKAGNKDGGVVLAIGEIAIDARGRYFLSRSEGKLVVGDLQQETMEVLDALPGPDIIGFWAHSSAPGFYLLSWTPPASGASSEGVEVLLSYDLDRRAIAWSRELPRQDGRLDVSAAGDRIFLSGGDDIIAVDPRDGRTLWTSALPHGLRDLDVSPDGHRVIVTGVTERDEDRLAWTSISVIAAADGRGVCEVTVPNCASDLVLDVSGRRGFLAPTSCGRDPVSVIELDGDACRFRENLPGFGPVALSPDGGTVVAFLDRDAGDPQAPPIPADVKSSADRYHLMFIDTETLAYTTAPLGAELPRYTFTPNGRSLLVDSDAVADEAAREEQIIILDIDARTVRHVAGPVIDLDQYALTPDAAHAFVVDRGLYDLDIAAARVDSIALPFVPVSLNMTPDGETLLLKSGIDSKVYTFAVDRELISGELAQR